MTGRPSGASPASALTGALGCDRPQLSPLATAARKLVRRALKGRTRADAAEWLGITRSTLQKILAEYPELAEIDEKST